MGLGIYPHFDPHIWNLLPMIAVGKDMDYHEYAMSIAFLCFSIDFYLEHSA